MSKTKIRRGIGYYGRIFMYGTAVTSNGARLSTIGSVPEQEENARKLNKHPAVKRAAKKRLLRDTARYHEHKPE